MTNAALVLKGKRIAITAQEKQDVRRWLRMLMGKDLILHFINFLFREVSNNILGDRGRERSELSEVRNY